jgi:hypothetical protein
VGINGTSYGSTTTAATNAGQYQASASFAGDTNHAGNSGSANFAITLSAPGTAYIYVLNPQADGALNVSGNANISISGNMWSIPAPPAPSR